MRTIFHSVNRFRRDPSGSLSIEAALMMPLIVFILVSTFTYFETFRADSVNIKAAYTIGDMLSRETVAVDAAYIEGLDHVFEYMTMARKPSWIRVTSVGFDSATNDFTILWSYGTDSHPAITATNFADIKSKIPNMPAGDTAIVVETYMPYDPEYTIGLKPFTFRNVVVTRPRFAPQLVWAS